MGKDVALHRASQRQINGPWSWNDITCCGIFFPCPFLCVTTCLPNTKDPVILRCIGNLGFFVLFVNVGRGVGFW